MIQRIQTIWFLLASLTLLLMFVFPISTNELNGVNFSLFSTGVYQNAADGKELNFSSNFFLIVANVIIAALCFVNIFNFKKRYLQKRIAFLCILLILALIGLSIFFVQQLPNGLAGANFGVGIYLPVVSILACIFAIVGIRKDDELLRSADRLR